MLVAVVVALALGLSGWRVSAQTLRPAGIPDLRDPEFRTRFVALSVGRLDGDPDFPALVLGNLSEGLPRFLVVILDARSGKDTWSLQEDAPVFFLSMADAETVQQAFLDEGFVTSGTPAGTFIVAGLDAAMQLLAKLRQSRKRLQSFLST
jgi:hypothetical protein